MRQNVGSAESQVREGTDRFIHDQSRMVDDFLELRSCSRALFRC